MYTHRVASTPCRLPKVTAWRHVRRHSRLGRSNSEVVHIQARDLGKHERPGTIALQRGDRLQRMFPPLLGPASHTCLSLGSRVRLRHGCHLPHQLHASLLVLFACAFGTRFLAHILQCVKDAALHWHRCAVHQGERFSQPSTCTPFSGQQPCSQEALHHHLPVVMILTACTLPVDDLPPPIWPEAERHQDHPLFPAALCALPLAFLRRDRCFGMVDRDPHPIHMQDRRHSGERGGVRGCGEGFHLSEPFVR